MTNPTADPLVGRTVSHYEILSRLGGGGMGVVYKAYDQRLGRPVALKFLPQQWSHDEAARQRFVREAQAASATHHPNICTIHDVAAADDGQMFIVMAYYDGQTLKERLDAGPLPIEEALDIATQLADGLAKAHAQGVVHRDIKPGNLILTEDGVRIVDFGLATFADALQLTADGSTLGTAAYMSPEQARGETVDARTDVWSAGVVLYQMLTGHVPFRGAYAEAVAYAIRHDAPPPIRAERAEVPEDVEQLVFRALHKDAAVRFASGRELARALRQVRGHSVPVDLRTTVVPMPSAPARPSRSSQRRRGAVVALAALLLTAAPGGWWLLHAPPRVPVIVAPVSNQNGYEAELGPYQLAMTHTLIARLGRSRDIRPVAYERLLEPLRRYAGGNGVPSGRAAVQAIADHVPASLILVPTLLHENGQWWARVRIEDAGNRAADPETVETLRHANALPKEAAYALIAELAERIDERLGSRRSRVMKWLDSLTSDEAASSGAYLRSLDAADAFVRGVDAYRRLEYATARDAFAAAVQRDPIHPLPVAWASRVAHLLGERQAALRDARRAVDLLSDATLPEDALFVRAVEAESDNQMASAERYYRELALAFADEPGWVLELAAFLQRTGNNDEAVALYDAALARDPRLVHPKLELCRLYSPAALSNVSLAARHGEAARAGYAALGDTVGEAQALLCLAEVLRGQEPDGPARATAAVDTALRIFREQRASYNLARALQYAGFVYGSTNNLRKAIESWEQSLGMVEPIGNTLLHATVLTNLGVAHNALGNHAVAAAYYRRSSLVNEARGDQRGAAYAQANAGAVAVEFGPNPEAGERDVRTALAVITQAKDLTFEVFCHKVLAAYQRYTGDVAAAEMTLKKARQMADDLGDPDEVAAITVDLGHVHTEAGDYAAARTAFADVIAAGRGRALPAARIGLARLEARVGAFAAAEALLTEASATIEQGDTDLRPLFHAVLGEVAYEAGRYDEARARFARAAALWSEELPDAASVEARGYVGLLDALRGRTREGEAAVRACVEHARTLRRVSIEARCRLHLARVLLARNPAEARAALEAAPADRVGPELRAQLHYWRGRAAAALGDDGAAAKESTSARQILLDVQRRLPAAQQPAFAARADNQLVLR